MTMKELKTALNAGLNMVNGFCFEGSLCNGWRQVNEEAIEFRYASNSRIVRVMVNEIAQIGKCRIYDERNGFKVPYPNVVLKSESRNQMD